MLFRKNRREQIIEKQLGDSQRVLKLTRSKQEKIDNTYRFLCHEMKEKEKFQELIFEAIKSPHSKRFKQKLNEV